MNDCGTPLNNRQLESYAQEDATILQMRNGSARDQASATFSSEVFSLLNNDSAQAVQQRAQELAACKPAAADAPAPTQAPADAAEQAAAAAVARQLGNPSIQLDTAANTVVRAFRPLSEDWMYRFADDINKMLQGTGVSLDVHHFRNNRNNLAVTVSGLSGGRSTEVFIGRPASN